MFKEENVITDDGVKIAFNVYKNGFKSVLIFLPGWFMTKDSRVFVQMCEVFSTFTDVVCLDFRGHGKSGGLYTFTAKEIADVKAVVNRVKTDYDNVFLIGFSLGASISLLYASNCDCIDKIIAVSPAEDFNKIENCFWKKEAWLPTLQKAEIKRWFSIRPEIPFRKKIKPRDVVEKITVPVLFIAGEKDPTVYPEHTEHLYEKAVCKKKYKLFKNCNHAEDLFLQRKTEFTEICRSWLIDE